MGINSLNNPMNIKEIPRSNVIASSNDDRDRIMYTLLVRL